MQASEPELTVYECERAKLKAFGTYTLPIEEKVNDLVEMTKKEFPEMDNYLIWINAVDYVWEEKGLKKMMNLALKCMKIM